MSAALDPRAGQVLAACAVSVAVVGVVTAYSTDLPVRRPAVQAERYPGLSRAPTYTQERERHHDNRLRHPGNLRAMAEASQSYTDAGAPTEQEHAEALARRASRRAYDGAPPTVPHPVSQRDWPACLTCHGTGMRVGAQVAPAICHTRMQSCTQCHVAGESPVPGVATQTPDNDFAGLEAPRRGERAWPGAPPTIPHPTLMRARCESCHGALALGLRTPHPWRASCTQCHAPSAALDQREASAQNAP